MNHFVDSNDYESDKFDRELDEMSNKIDHNRIKHKDDNQLKLVETVFDAKTRLILFSMINKGLFTSITGAISTGKEANVYYAPTGDNNGIAIKIFRIDAPSFKKMRTYVEGDFRFKRVSTKRSGFIEVWAKKEFKNLQRMKTHGIPVPTPIKVERNILLLEFLGDGEQVLPILKETQPNKPGSMYKSLMEDVKNIYRKAMLVHADLSEYNVLYNSVEDKYFIIDVSQAVLLDHPRANEFLARDLNNLNRYFSSLGVEIIDLEKLFKWVTGFEMPATLLLEYSNI